jgi:hypothetical protein
MARGSLGEMKRLASILGLCLVLMPSVAHAQASITGAVKDASGAVLPGVTVEASSPALIEKVRTVVTDGTGQYTIVDLRPGTYAVTFTLTGFTPIKREGIELSGSFAATVNAELKVGSVAETVTVTGEAPTVDVQTTQKSNVVTSEEIAALPSVRNQYSVAVLLPGVTQTTFGTGNQQDVGGVHGLEIELFTVHGSRPYDQRLMINGLTSRNLGAQAWSSHIVPDMGAAAEVTLDYSSGSAEAIGAGFTMNVIPKEGGNAFRGSFFGYGVNGSWQGNNYSDELKAAGLSSPNTLHVAYDINPSVGGPIVKDKLWFFGSMRWQENSYYLAGSYANKNSGDLTKWTYVPDPNVRGENILTEKPGVSVRLTWQATPKNKISYSADPQERYWQFSNPSQAPESWGKYSFPHNSIQSITWSAPLTSRLLVDARFGHQAETQEDFYPAPNDFFYKAIPVLELSNNFLYRGAGYARAPAFFFPILDAPHIMEAKASVSYVTGAHALKIGFQDDFGTNTNVFRDNAYGLYYQFNNAVPVSLEQHAMPFSATAHLGAELGIYAQDKWTFKRMTLNGGVRFDYFLSDFPAQHLGPTVWTPARDFTIPATDYADLKDITPRVGVAYDLFGDGKTALKAAWGKFMGGQDPNLGNPIENLAFIAHRQWTPSLPPGNPNYYTPQCDLLNPAANGDCGALDNALFGQLTPSAAVDPATYTGWGNRFWSQEFSASVQREVIPRVSVDFGYFRRWYGNFQVVQNRAVTPNDFTQYSITVPNDPRLSRAGQVLGGFYEVNPALAGAVNNYTTFSDNFGTEQEHWNGFDLTINARPRTGVLLQGGLNWGRVSGDVCQIEAALPETQTQYGIFAYSRNDCHLNEPFQTQLKLLGTYLIPKIDVQIGVTFQSAPGPPEAANYFILPGQAGLPSFSGAGVRLASLVPQLQPTPFQFATAPWSARSAEYYPRANQLDLRFSKIFRVGPGGRYRTMINFDLSNALNSSDVLAFNNTYGNSWQAPLSIMDARLLKLSGQFDF